MHGNLLRFDVLMGLWKSGAPSQKGICREKEGRDTKEDLGSGNARILSLGKFETAKSRNFLDSGRNIVRLGDDVRFLVKSLPCEV